MALTQDTGRGFELNAGPGFNELPVAASAVIYQGAAVGLDSGNARPLVAGDAFAGFAVAKADNGSGSAGDLTVKLRSRGRVRLAVVGVEDADDVGETVYASDDGTFTLDDDGGANTAVGKVADHVNGTTCVVEFEAGYARSL